jgi:hypothetical protein
MERLLFAFLGLGDADDAGYLKSVHGGQTRFILVKQSLGRGRIPFLNTLKRAKVPATRRGLPDLNPPLGPGAIRGFSHAFKYRRRIPSLGREDVYPHRHGHRRQAGLAAAGAGVGRQLSGRARALHGDDCPPGRDALNFQAGVVNRALGRLLFKARLVHLQEEDLTQAQLKP